MKDVHNYWPKTCEQHNFCQLCAKTNKEVGIIHDDLHLQKTDIVLTKQGGKTHTPTVIIII
jgi:hypothetical protein